MRRSRYLAAILAACTLHAAPAPADEPRPDAGAVRFFEARIRPLLADNCFRCHGAEKQRGDLRLDSADALRRGGASGSSPVVPGHPEKSLLIKAVLHGDENLQMPPSRKLSDREIADLTHWVRAGAVYPGPVNVAAGEKHWAFTPPGDPTPPAVKDAQWVRNPVDAFILAKLEAKGLRPAPPADRRTLLRRVTFDLTGLPPTPAEVDAFLADGAPDAYEKVVDRLLSSPHYGERWGRHWLDVARYADSNGLDENVAFGNAWRYRDYVVQAFNRDVPYDRFLGEQLAGDLLPASDPDARRRQLVATGFLALGPKVLAEVDEKKMEMDILDEQLDTLGRAVLALTLGCARCHNHKFDPVTMEDYYGLLGIFQSTKTMETFTKVARWHENPIPADADLARQAEHDAKVAGLNTEIQKLTAAANEELQAAAAQPLPKEPEPLYPADTRAALKELRDKLAALQKSAPVLPTAMGVTEGRAGDARLIERGNHLTPGRAVPRRFPEFLAGDNQPSLPAGASGRLELARWLTSPDHPLTARVMVNRVWRWHFGRGLVKSVDNFGRLGEPPSHPELLDWLARRFVEGAWSVKKLHRLILLSNTYRMGGTHDAAAATADPEDALRWRFDVRRLEAEEIRDATLAVSGLLDRAMGGSLLHVENRKYFFDHTSKDLTDYSSRRRSIYLPVVRNNLYPVFQLFDTTDGAVSSGDRATTTVATQALFLLNSDLVADAADQLAESLLARQELDDEGRVALLYRTAYARPPTRKEVARNRAALAGFEQELRHDEPDADARRQRAWGLLCHAVLASNEFVYLR